MIEKNIKIQILFHFHSIIQKDTLCVYLRYAIYTYDICVRNVETDYGSIVFQE
jgi:hypothetical protein